MDYKVNSFDEIVQFSDSELNSIIVINGTNPLRVPRRLAELLITSQGKTISYSEIVTVISSKNEKETRKIIGILERNFYLSSHPMPKTKGFIFDFPVFQIFSVRPKKMSIFLKPFSTIFNIRLYLIVTVLSIFTIIKFGSKIIDTGESKVHPGMFLVLILISSLLHEVAHMAALYRYTKTYSYIGFSFVTIWPSLFVDLSSIHVLKKLDRVSVNAAGIFVNLSIFLLSSAIYIYNMNRYAQFSAILNVIMAFTNLLPLRRFDGYWIINDTLDQKLQKSFGFLAQVLLMFFLVYSTWRLLSKSIEICNRVICYEALMRFPFQFITLLIFIITTVVTLYSKRNVRTS